MQQYFSNSSKYLFFFSVLHAIFYIGIAISSAIAAHAFSEIFDTFNSRCILYARPVFSLDKIEYIQIESHDSTTEITKEFTTEFTTELATEFTTETDGSMDLITIMPLNESTERKRQVSNPEIIISDSKKPSDETHNWNNGEQIPGTDNYFLFNDTVYFKNNSLYGEINIKTSRRKLSPLFICDYVLFTPLFSLVVASVLLGIVIVYGRGGRGVPGET